MFDDLYLYIKEQKLSPFTQESTTKSSTNPIFKTREAKNIHQRVLSHLAQKFQFNTTSQLLDLFNTLPNNLEQRQAFFKQLQDQPFLSLPQLSFSPTTWKPSYSLIIATEDENLYLSYLKQKFPVTLLRTPHDLADIKEYDLVYATNCERYESMLEECPNVLFVDEEEVYLERYLVMLASYSTIITTLKNYNSPTPLAFITPLSEFLDLLTSPSKKKLTRDDILQKLEEINRGVSSSLATMTVRGDALYTLFSTEKLPKDILEIVAKNITQSGLPATLFTQTIPIKVDDQELQTFLTHQTTSSTIQFAKALKKNAATLMQIPHYLTQLNQSILILDFCAGISHYLQRENLRYPQLSHSLTISDAHNLFLEQSQPVTFYLNQQERCSILTGANSGGKTTLLELVIQSITLAYLGLPVQGNITTPLFHNIYYFAKNKGSTSKGAFETLLTDLAKIKSNEPTLLLADEMEAVTEPGAAAQIIRATCQFFIDRNCFIIMASHLGRDISTNLPTHTRIDGIVAKGLDENMNLIIDHNPVLGILAHSTPELIVERLATTTKTDYFKYLNQQFKTSFIHT
ncbi:hypothetical protein HYV86_06070 [Candidatus Woesearchaeota archaeon]|nr:hypothetical protein [Candidatus Woesearchaeota archaeon]